MDDSQLVLDAIHVPNESYNLNPCIYDITFAISAETAVTIGVLPQTGGALFPI